jgi:type I site-specific restriction-modification system R (restriction) subunit
VNGIPLVIIECKSPYIKDPIQEAVEANFERYQSRGAGYERLMFYNHFLVATSGTTAKHGTIGARINHYARWSEAYPLTEEEVQKMSDFNPRVFAANSALLPCSLSLPIIITSPSSGCNLSINSR